MRAVRRSRTGSAQKLDARRRPARSGTHSPKLNAERVVSMTRSTNTRASRQPW